MEPVLSRILFSVLILFTARLQFSVGNLEDSYQEDYDYGSENDSDLLILEHMLPPGSPQTATPRKRSVPLRLEREIQSFNYYPEDGNEPTESQVGSSKSDNFEQRFSFNGVTSPKEEEKADNFQRGGKYNDDVQTESAPRNQFDEVSAYAYYNANPVTYNYNTETGYEPAKTNPEIASEYSDLRDNGSSDKFSDVVQSKPVATSRFGGESAYSNYNQNIGQYGDVAQSEPVAVSRFGGESAYSNYNQNTGQYSDVVRSEPAITNTFEGTSGYSNYKSNSGQYANVVKSEPSAANQFAYPNSGNINQYEYQRIPAFEPAPTSEFNYIPPYAGHDQYQYPARPKYPEFSEESDSDHLGLQSPTESASSTDSYRGSETLYESESETETGPTSTTEFLPESSTSTETSSSTTTEADFETDSEGKAVKRQAGREDYSPWNYDSEGRPLPVQLDPQPKSSSQINPTPQPKNRTDRKGTGDEEESEENEGLLTGAEPFDGPRGKALHGPTELIRRSYNPYFICGRNSPSGIDNCRKLCDIRDNQRFSCMDKFCYCQTSYTFHKPEPSDTAEAVPYFVCGRYDLEGYERCVDECKKKPLASVQCGGTSCYCHYATFKAPQKNSLLSAMESRSGSGGKVTAPNRLRASYCGRAPKPANKERKAFPDVNQKVNMCEYRCTDRNYSCNKRFCYCNAQGTGTSSS